MENFLDNFSVDFDKMVIQERKRSNRPHDFLIQERQKMETQRQIAQDQKTAQDAFDLMNDWQIRTGNIIRVRNPKQDPDGGIENSGKSIFEIRIPNFCYIQVIVFDLNYLPVAAVGTWQVRYHEKIVKTHFFSRNFQFHRRGPRGCQIEN